MLKFSASQELEQAIEGIDLNTSLGTDLLTASMEMARGLGYERLYRKGKQQISIHKE